MSSFVISKENYIKAAGIVAGIAEVTDMFVFDYQKGRKMTAADFYDKFTQLFEMNALSVQEEWGEEEPEQDNNTYMPVWNKALQAGKQKAYHGDLLQITLGLIDFFSSIVYQIEKPAYMWNARSFWIAYPSSLSIKRTRTR